MKRRSTRLQSEAAEFRVLAELLMLDVPSFKGYTNTPGYDIVATAPDRHRSARISVKSRWSTDATGFIIKSLDCDFVVIVKLNRGTAKDATKTGDPEFFIIPIRVIKRVPRSEGWNRMEFRKIPKFESFKGRWDLIQTFLAKGRK